MERLGCVVVTFGEASELNESKATLSKHSIPTIVVDTGSIPTRLEDAIESCKDLTKDPVTIAIGNLGFGTAANVGAGLLNSAIPMMQWLLICNGDARLSDQCIEWCKIAASSPATQCYGIPEATDQDAHRRLFPSVSTLLGEMLIGHRAAVTRWEHSVYAKGAAILLPVDVFQSAGGFDPEFFLYFEETDLFFRIRDSGIPLRFAPAWAGVAHRGGAQTGRVAPLAAFELGRSAGRYAQKRGHRGLTLAFALNFTAVSARKFVRGHPRSASHSLLSLFGLLLGTVSSRELLPASRLRAIPRRERHALSNQFFRCG